MTSYEKDLTAANRRLHAALQWALPLAIEASAEVCIGARAEAALDSRIAFARSALIQVEG